MWVGIHIHIYVCMYVCMCIDDSSVHRQLLDKPTRLNVATQSFEAGDEGFERGGFVSWQTLYHIID